MYHRRAAGSADSGRSVALQHVRCSGVATRLLSSNSTAKPGHDRQ